MISSILSNFIKKTSSCNELVQAIGKRNQVFKGQEFSLKLDPGKILEGLKVSAICSYFTIACMPCTKRPTF